MPNDYLVPPRTASEDTILGWCRASIEEGDRFLKAQRAYKDIDLAYDIVAGDEREEIPTTLSDLKLNLMKRQIREVVAVESNIRPDWGYKTGNPKADETNNILNNLHKGWWLNTFADRALKEVLQWAAVTGTGWISPIWEKNFPSIGQRDIKLYTYGPRDVKPVQMGPDHNIQRAYGVLMVTEVPINLARANFPEFADKIKPDRGEPTYLRSGMSRISRWLSPLMRVLESEKEDHSAQYPTVDIFNYYIMDGEINKSGHPIPMGSGNWAYVVPYLGQDIPTNLWQNGQRLYRKADWDDCRVYPQRRLITFCRSARLYDGTSSRWDGMVPAVKVTTDSWPWEFLGYSMVRDGHTLQRSIISMMRAVIDKVNAGLRPALGYDDNVSASLMERLDPRQPGQKAKINYQMGEGIKTLLPAEFYQMQPYVLPFLELLFDKLDYIFASRDMTNLAKAGQIPSTEAIEKILEVSGPLITDISRDMEKSMTELGELVKPMFFQHYDARRRVPLLGKDGITSYDFNFDPATMLPAGDDPVVNAAMPPSEKLREYLKSFTFHVTPGSMHQITQMTRKMLYIQMWRMGFPIDPWTMAEQLDIPNFGAPPQGITSVMERWKAWLSDQSQFMSTLQALAALRVSMMGLGGQNGPPASAGQPGSGPGGHPGPGRQPSGNVPPHLEAKDGGARSTIAES